MPNIKNVDYGKHRLTTSPDADLCPQLHITKAKKDLETVRLAVRPHSFYL